MECFDSDGSDFELDFEGFESEREEDIEDPLDTAQEWSKVRFITLFSGNN